MYVIPVEQALFLVGAAGALLMHYEQACVRMDLECLENGPLYFSVLYGVSLLASVGARGSRWQRRDVWRREKRSGAEAT